MTSEFTELENRSAFDKYPKEGRDHIISMHMHPHILRMNRWAVQAGAELLYEAKFECVEYDADGKIRCVQYTHNGETVTAGTKLVEDCSGIASVVRRSLPDGYGVENFELTPLDMFYVNLRYVKYGNSSSAPAK